MQRFFGLGVLMLSARLLACSGSSSTDSGTTAAGRANAAGDASVAAGTTAAGGVHAGGASGAGQGGTFGTAASSGNSGSAGAFTAAGGGASGGDDTSACPPWPQQRLMPIIGPFFYGPDPGPCSSKDDLDTSKYTYEDGVLKSELRRQHGLESTTTYSADAQGRLMTSSDGAASDSFEFGPSSLVDTTTRNGSLEQQVTYSLSPSGYPLTAVVSAPNQAVRTVTYSYESCRLFQRTITAATGTLVEQDSYSYDSAGHVIARSNGTAQQIYDYSCW